MKKRLTFILMAIFTALILGLFLSNSALADETLVDEGEISVNEKKTVSFNNINDRDEFHVLTFTPDEDGIYAFYSTLPMVDMPNGGFNNACDPEVSVYLKSGEDEYEKIGEDSDDVAFQDVNGRPKRNLNFYYIARFSAGKEYQFRINNNMDDPITSEIPVTLEKINAYEETPAELGKVYTVTPEEGVSTVYYIFTPEETANYYFTVGGMNNTRLCLFCEEGSKMISWKPGLPENTDSVRYMPLDAEKTYYIMVHNSDISGAFGTTLMISKEKVTDCGELKTGEKKTISRNTADEKDVFSFKVNDGEEARYYLDVKTVPGVCVYLYDKSSGTSVFSQYFYPKSSESMGTIGFLKAGDYDLGVTGCINDVHTGEVSLTVVKGNDMVKAGDIAVDETKTLDLEKFDRKYFEFTPEENGTYAFYSDFILTADGADTKDTCVYIYASDDLLVAIDYNDDVGGSVSSRGFCIVTDKMIKDKTYYLIPQFCHEAEEAGEITVTLKKVEEGHVHNFSKVIAANDPTCEFFGYTVYECEGCGCRAPSSGGWPTGHDFVVKETTASCTEGGITTYECSYCGKTKTEEVGPLGHYYSEYVNVEAGCTSEGYYGYKCSRCEKFGISGRYPVMGHNWSVWEEVAAAGENTDGKEKRHCNRDGCDASEERVIPAGNHIHNIIQVAEQKPTCIKDGLGEHYSCTLCGRLFSDENGENEVEESDLKIRATGHTEGEAQKENAVAVTCETDGSYDSVKKCTKCGAELSRSKYMDWHKGHDWGEWKTVKEPTVFEKGEQKRVCKNDPEHTETRDLPSLSHAHTMTPIEGYDPDCINSGRKDYYQCSICQLSYEDEAGVKLITDDAVLIIPPLGHDFSIDISKAETCTEDGFSGYKCSRCNETDGETINALGHDMVEKSNTVTCTEAGVKTSECSRCHSVETENLAALGHDNVWESVAATCTEDGYDGYRCSRCNELSVSNTYDALGHDWGSWVEITPAGEHTKGLERRECLRGGCDVVEERDIPELTHEHVLVKVDAVSPTCTEKGLYEHWKCTECNRLFWDEEGSNEANNEEVIVSAYGHTYGHYSAQNRIEPTCEVAGSYDEVQICPVCSTELSRTTYNIPAIGHDLSVWATTTEPTADYDGEQTRTCGRPGCTYKETRALPKTTHTHSMSPVSGTPETCTTNGVKAYYLCSSCGLSFNDEAGNDLINDESSLVIPAAHLYGDPEYSWTADAHSCTAVICCHREGCAADAVGHILKTETVIYEAGKADSAIKASVKTEATEEKNGTTTYTATFADADFTVQSKDVDDIPKIVKNVPLTGIALSKTALELKIGTTAALTVNALPTDATETLSVTWASSRPDVATVANGIITPVSMGTTTITATCGSFTAVCTVKVTGYTVSAEGDQDYSPDYAPEIPEETDKLSRPEVKKPDGTKARIDVTTKYDKAVNYTGNAIDPEKMLNAKLDVSGIKALLPELKSGYTADKLIQTAFVTKNGVAASKGKAYFYGKIKLAPDKELKLAGLTTAQIKLLKQQVKAANSELKKKENRCYFTINRHSLADGRVTAEVAKTKDGAIKLKANGAISKVKWVKIEVPETGKIIKLSAKDYVVTLADKAAGTIRITGKRNFSGSITVKVQ